MKYCCRNVIYAFGILWYRYAMNKKADEIVRSRPLIYIFEENISQRKLYHTPQGVYHHFAAQSDITAYWAYPYAQYANRCFCLSDAAGG